MRRLIQLTLSLASVFAAPAVAQDVQLQDKKQDKKPVAWPALKGTDQQKVRFLLRKLENEDPPTVEQAEVDLTAVGAGAAPILLRRLGDRKVDNRESVEAVLDRIVADEYTPLICNLGRKPDPVRVWCVRRLARAGDRAMIEVLEQATEDKNEDVVFYAKLGLAGLGDLSGMETVFERCSGAWRELAELVGEVLPAARSNEAADWVLGKMSRDDEQSRITGLRLLRSLAPKEYAGIVKLSLDAHQHSIKKEAINTLRVIVDGDPPLENLSVFQAIEMAKEWKART